MKLFIFGYSPLRRDVVSTKRIYVHEVQVKGLAKLTQENVWLGVDC